MVPGKGSVAARTTRLSISLPCQKSLKTDRTFFSLIQDWCGGKLGKPCILCAKMQYFKTKTQALKEPGFESS